MPLLARQPPDRELHGGPDRRHNARTAAQHAGRPLLLNSLIMALVIAFGKIAISLLSAFAIVYFRFPFRMLVFWTIFVTLMLPVEVRILPTYEVVADLGMLNTYTGLTVPLIASATATFLFRQFFLTVPDELVEAARMDGAGPMRFFKDMLLPLSRQHGRPVRDPVHLRLEPVSLAAAGDHRRGHVPGGHRHQADDHGGDAATEWNVVMATAMLALIPPALVVMLMQRLVRQGPGRHREVGHEASTEQSSMARNFDYATSQELRQALRPVEVIKGVNAEMADGEIMVIVGPSGCGKSTLLRMVAGLEKITGARSASAGAWSTTLEPTERDIAMVFQNYALYPHMTVYDNMAYGLKNAKVPLDRDRTRVAGRAASSGWSRCSSASRASFRAASASASPWAARSSASRRCSCSTSRCPTSTPSCACRCATRSSCAPARHHRLYVTHDQVEAMTLGDRLMVMNAGMEQVGTPLEVYGGRPAPTSPASSARRHEPPRGRRLGRDHKRRGQILELLQQRTLGRRIYFFFFFFKKRGKKKKKGIRLERCRSSRSNCWAPSG